MQKHVSDVAFVTMWHPAMRGRNGLQAAGRADVDILGNGTRTAKTASALGETQTAATSAGRAGVESDNFLGGALRFVQNLHTLSVKLMKDAESDRRTFSKSASAKKSKRAAAQ